VKLIKVALDVNIPQRLVLMLNSGFRDQGYEFIWEPEFAAPNAEDEHWATAFRRFGGSIVITGDKNIAKRPHQIKAFQDNELICFFCERTWSSFDMTFKCSHLLMWWMRIQKILPEAKPRDCWWIPLALRDVPLTKVLVPDGIGKERKPAKPIGTLQGNRPPARLRRGRGGV
jgi:hypothetical protein